MRQRKWIVASLCLFLLLGCGSATKSGRGAVEADSSKSPYSNNLTGFPVAFPLEAIPRRNQRRYINHNGGEAIVYYFAGKAHILVRATERFGDFQALPYASKEDPVVFPLGTGQVFVASKDGMLIRDVCPDVICSFSEFLSAPTGDTPLAFDQDSDSASGSDSTLYMVNGTRWVYSYNLLERKWSQSFALPAGKNAIAVKRIGTDTLLLDSSAVDLLINLDGNDNWRRVSLPGSSNDPPTQIAQVGESLVLATKKTLWTAKLSSILDVSHNRDTKTSEFSISWNLLASPNSEQIIQISSDKLFLYCTTSSGDTFRIHGKALSDSGLPAHWVAFDPYPFMLTEHQPIQRLRWIDRELVGFSVDGANHSRNYGLSWRREAPVAGQPIRLDEAALAGNLYAVTRTTLLVTTPGGAKEGLWHTIGPLSVGCIANQTDEETSGVPPLLQPINAHSLAIITTDPGIVSQGVCLFDTNTKQLTSLSSGWQPSKLPISLIAIDDHMIMGSDRGLTVWDSAKGSWGPSAQTVPFDGSPPNGGVTAIAAYGDHGIILATESRAIFFKEKWDAAHPWTRVSDKFDSVVNPANGNLRISFIWVNPRRLSEIYLVINQIANISLYFRDRANTMFSLVTIPNDRASGLIANDEGQLWITGSNNSYYINTNRPAIGSWEDFSERFQDKAGTRLRDPITWISGVFITYLIAVLSVLALRFLPVSPVLGRSWLASLIVKPFNISPLVGRWILFLGYKSKIQKERLIKSVYFGLPAVMPGGTTVSPDDEGRNLCEKVLGEARQSGGLLVSGRPGSGKSMLLARLAYTSTQKKLLPVLVTPDAYNGDLIESASRLLKERYGIPLDKEDLLIGQMQVGGILFLFDGLSEVSISRGAAIADLTQVLHMPEFKRCSLIISARPFEGQPEIPTCQILPVRGEDAISKYLPLFKLPPEEQNQVEISLRAFRNEPVDVQLLTMTIEARGKGSFRQRSEIFRAFFQKRLAAEGSDSVERWNGWSFALENLAKWFCLETGVKSIGLSQRATIDAIESVEPAEGGQGIPRNLLSELRDTFSIELPTPTPGAFLSYLRTTGILVRIDRWKFAHDSFEEFFCASYLAKIATRERKLPGLALWRQRPEELIEVFAFLREMLDPESRSAICQADDLPAIWKEKLIVDQ